jgi:hypothetical protein
MNYNKNLVKFVILITVSLFSLSILDNIYDFNLKSLNNINILSDIVKKETPKKTIAASVDSIQVVAIDTATNRIFKDFSLPNRLTEYQSAETVVAMKNFIDKLIELKKGKRKKIRIAYLGDSMIEEDFITQTFRKLMQKEFGGYGIGYFPLSSELAGERSTAIISSKKWVESNFNTNPNKLQLYISGRCFSATENAFTDIKDKTALPSNSLEKYLLFGATNKETTISLNGINHSLNSNNNFNAMLLDSSIGNTLKLETNSADNLFGVSLEAPQGVTVDNFSFRGISGNEFSKMDSSFLANISKNHSYDLIIMEYGVNLFVKPTDDNFNWFYKPFTRAINKLKASFPNSNILIVSSADRAYKYDGVYQTAVGMPNLLALQQKAAYETGSAFYNTFESMGGNGSIARWVDTIPSLSYKDYMHPNNRGSEIIGKSIFDAIMFEYKKAIQKNK